MGIFKQMAEYLYLRKRDPNEQRTKYQQYMHGMNRISLLVFIAALVFMLIKLVIFPMLKK